MQLANNLYLSSSNYADSYEIPGGAYAISSNPIVYSMQSFVFELSPVV